MARSDRGSAALRRVHRAYEATHMLAGLRGLAIAGALCLVAVGLYRMTHHTWLVVGTLGATLTVLAWRGGAWRRGAYAGVLAGLPPLIVPAIVFAMSAKGGHCASCETTATLPCLLACFGTSSLVGILVGYRAIQDAVPRHFAPAAIATAALAGLLGCGTTGLGGAIGVIVGLVAGGLSGWAFAGRIARA